MRTTTSVDLINIVLSLKGTHQIKSTAQYMPITKHEHKQHSLFSEDPWVYIQQAGWACMGERERSEGEG